MADVYKGLTVKIGADTTGFSKALREAKREATGTATQLNQIQKALKFDPGNTKLLAQQQEVYQKRINATAKELETLRALEAQAGQDNLSSEQWTKLQSDIAIAETKLASYNQELIKVNREQAINHTTLGKAANSLEAFGEKHKKLGTNMQSFGSKMTNFVTKPAVAAATAISTISIAKGFSRLNEIDQARAKLTALGHDAQSVEAIANSALASVKGTAFGLNEAMTAASVASAAGVKSGEEMTKYLTMVADAASIAGTDLGQMGDILGKVQNTNRAYLGQLNQLATAGLPIYQWLADEIGVTTEEVRKMASAGEISSEIFFNAIQKNVGGAAKVIGEQSLKGAIDNVGAALGRVGASFLDAGGKGGGFFSQLKPLMVELTQALDDMEGTAAEMGAAFGEAFANGVNALRDLVKWFNDLSPAGKKAVGVFAAIAVAGGPVINMTGKLIGNSKEIASAMRKVAGIMPSVQKETRTLATAQKEQSVSGEAVAASNQKIGASSKIAATGTKALHTATKALKAVGIVALFSAIGSAVGGLISDMAAASDRTKALEKATTGLEGSMRAIESAYDKASQSAQNNADSIDNIGSSAEEVIQKQGDLAQSLTDMWSDVGTNSALLDGYVKTIRELGDTELKTRDEQAKLTAAVEGFNDITGSSISVIDPLNGKLSEQKDSILAVADAYKEQAKAQAAQEALVEIEKQRIITASQLKAEQEKLDAMEEGFIVKSGDFVWAADEKGLAYDEQREKVEGLRKAEESLLSQYDEAAKVWEDNYLSINQSSAAIENWIKNTEGMQGALEANGVSVDEFSSLLEELGISQDQLSKMTPENLAEITSAWSDGTDAVKAKLDEYKESVHDALDVGTRTALEAMSEALVSGNGIASDQVATLRSTLEKATEGLDEQTSADTWAAIEGILAKLEDGGGILEEDVAVLNSILGNVGVEFAQTAPENAGDGVGAYAETIEGGAGDAEAASSALEDAAADGLDDWPDDAAEVAQDGVDAYTDTIESGSDDAESAAESIAQSADSGARSVSGDGAGAEFAAGYARGIASGAYGVRAEARSIAQQALSEVRATQDSNSPAKKSMYLGEDFGEGYGVGIKNMYGLVKKNSMGLTSIALTNTKAVNAAQMARKTAINHPQQKGQQVVSTVNKYYLDGWTLNDPPQVRSITIDTLLDLVRKGHL